MTQRTLEELNAVKNRMEADIRRSRLQQVDGMSRQSPLLKNLEQVNREIKAITESK